MKTKERIKSIRAQIEVLEQEQQTIQDDCPHTETFKEARYWRLAASCNYEICCECDYIVKNLDLEFLNNAFNSETDD